MRRPAPLWRTLVFLALGAASLPLTLPWVQRQELPPLLSAPLSAVLTPLPAGLEGTDQEMLFHALAEADAAWAPRAEWLADGRIVYHYKRRSGDPPLSLPEIRALMADPPRFERERDTLRNLLQVLRLAGVTIQLAQPRKPAAAAEWDPRAGTIRIRPEVVERGSAAFAVVLNHEAIHVAQSCRRGHLLAMPHPLGLSDTLTPELELVLKEALYRSSGPLERQLEREAYANQHQLQLGVDLVRSHCRLAKD